MKRRSHIYLLLLVLSCLGGCADRGAGPARWNVVLVTLDTTRADRLGCYGFEKETSPHMDALAAEGVLFETAIAQAAVTPVSHASILTGLNPYQHGVRVMYAADGYRLPSDVPTLTTILKENGYRTAAFLSAFPVSDYFGFQNGFDLFDTGLSDPADSIFQKEADGLYRWDLVRNQRRSDETTDQVIRWLGEERSPFFLWVHYWDPHDVFVTPPQEVAALFLAGTEGQTERKLALYDAEVFYMDSQFGRLIETLKERGLWKNTAVVVVADHGEGLDDHGWWNHRILYQEQIRVPLLIRFPGAPEGVRVTDLVRTIDIVPTLLDALGLKPPAPVEGRSLLPLMTGSPEPPRIAYADQLNLYDLNAAMLARRPLDDLLYCAMDGTWKLVYRPTHPEQSELYHLAEDPRELENLYSDGHAEVARLREELDRFDGFVESSFGEGVDAEVLERLRSLGYVEE